MKCSECAYYWKDSYDKYETCHFEPSPWDNAPCEEDEPQDTPDVWED